VTALVAAARAAKMNAVMVEVRKRGDAYFRGGLEPLASDVTGSTFDPLEDLVTKAHDTTGGKARIDVHAWCVTYNIWNNETTLPPQATHPYRLHPEWATQKWQADPLAPPITWTGAPGGSGNYMFDPGLPAVQQHTYDVLMDILTRYDIDGLHFDYIRYPDWSAEPGITAQPYGYHPQAVARFNTQKGRTGIPLPEDDSWEQWRRDQVSGLVRKVYLQALARKPQVRVSAASIVYGVNPPSATTAAAWRTSSAFSSVLQDWRSWLEEGIIDLACPMLYRSQVTYPTSVAAWVAYAREQQFNRATAIGLGWYLNAAADTPGQIALTRAVGASGKKSAGVLGYSYYAFDSASYATEAARNTARTAFWTSLTTGASAPFPTTDTVPAMPWKTAPTSAHLMGFATDATTGLPLDAATLTLTGPTTRTLTTDGTGFYGAVDLPPGTYTVEATLLGYQPRRTTLTVAGGVVTSLPTALGPPVLAVTTHSWVPATRLLSVQWSSQPGKRYQLEESPSLASNSWTSVGTALTATTYNSSTTATTAQGATRRFFRVKQLP
jgi:uncharacterized lipoprotein YddW (UPF0748 family)